MDSCAARTVDLPPVTVHFDLTALLEIPIFIGSLDVEAFIHWLNKIDWFFKIMEISEECKVAIVSTNLREEQKIGGRVYVINVIG